MRAFFADGVDSMHIPWAVEGLPTLLHLLLSLFRVFCGLVICLFQADHEVSSYAVWWIELFSMVLWIDHTAAVNSTRYSVIPSFLSTPVVTLHLDTQPQ